MLKWRKIIVAGANAGIKQKGKNVSTSTPWAPVSILSLVKSMAMKDVAMISSKPKVFHIKAILLASFFLCFNTCLTQMLLAAVSTSPKPAMSPKTIGKLSLKYSRIKKPPMNLKRCRNTKSSTGTRLRNDLKYPVLKIKPTKNMTRGRVVNWMILGVMYFH